MRRKYLNDPTRFLHFCDYPPLKRTSTFIWINLHSHQARHVYTKFDWIWPDSFQYTNVKHSFPSCVPTLTPGNHNLYKLKSALWLIDWLFTVLRPLKNFLLTDVIIAGEGLQNLTGTSISPVSCEGPSHLVASYDSRGDVDDLF
jgi:hypothetical protein